MNLCKDFETMHGYVTRCIDSKLDLIAVDAHDNDANVATDHNGLISFAAEHKHGALLGRREREDAWFFG